MHFSPFWLFSIIRFHNDRKRKVSQPNEDFSQVAAHSCLKATQTEMETFHFLHTILPPPHSVFCFRSDIFLMCEGRQIWVLTACQKNPTSKTGGSSEAHQQHKRSYTVWGSEASRKICCYNRYPLKRTSFHKHEQCTMGTGLGVEQISATRASLGGEDHQLTSCEQ